MEPNLFLFAREWCDWKANPLKPTTKGNTAVTQLNCQRSFLRLQHALRDRNPERASHLWREPQTTLGLQTQHSQPEPTPLLSTAEAPFPTALPTPPHRWPRAAGGRIRGLIQPTQGRGALQKDLGLPGTPTGRCRGASRGRPLKRLLLPAHSRGT